MELLVCAAGDCKSDGLIRSRKGLVRGRQPWGVVLVEDAVRRTSGHGAKEAESGSLLTD